MAGSINYRENRIWINNLMRSMFFDIMAKMTAEEHPEIHQKIESDDELQMLAHVGGMFIPMEQLLSHFDSKEQYLVMAKKHYEKIDAWAVDGYQTHMRKLFRCVDWLLTDNSLDWSDAPDLHDIDETGRNEKQGAADT